MFKFERNEERGQYVANFSGLLKKISEKPVGQFPSGKEFRAGDIEFSNSKGDRILASVIINEANYQRSVKDGSPMTVGNSYLCQAIVTDAALEAGIKSPLLICSHLTATAPRASLDDFGFDAAELAKVNSKELLTA